MGTNRVHYAAIAPASSCTLGAISHAQFQRAGQNHAHATNGAIACTVVSLSQTAQLISAFTSLLDKIDASGVNPGRYRRWRVLLARADAGC